MPTFGSGFLISDAFLISTGGATTACVTGFAGGAPGLIKGLTALAFFFF
jgi:hypothetical protein